MARQKQNKYVDVNPTLNSAKFFLESVSDEYLVALSEGDYYEAQRLAGGNSLLSEAIFDVVHGDNGLMEAIRPLDIQQRKKRAMIMHRYAARLSAARNRLRMRRKSEDKLLRKSRKLAIAFLRKRVLKDRNYNDLSASEKIAVDRRLARIPESVIERIARKQLPIVKQLESKRMATINIKEGFGDSADDRLEGTDSLVKVYKKAMGISETFIAAPETTLGIERHQMPQIADVPDFLKYLDSVGVKHERVDQDPISLKASQGEFNTDKIQKMMGFDGEPKEIMASRDGYVLDGHHRWLANVNDRVESIPTRVIDQPANEALETMKKYPKVFFKSLKESLANRIVKQ